MSTSTLTSTLSLAQSSGFERRRSNRQPYIIEAWLHPGGSRQGRIEVVTLNLSRHGVGFQFSEALTIESEHTLELTAGRRKMAMRLVIRRCMPLEDGFWEVGAEFC